jgi:hypothetical protein
MSAQQFRSVFPDIIRYKGVLDVANLVDAAGATSSVTVPGVRLGDVVLGVSLDVSLQGITVTAYVSAADTVQIRFQNESTATVDLAATAVLRLVVAKVAD